MNKQSIIIDTDPGIDDAIALFFAMASPELNILGITTVAGNVEIPLAYKNALEIVRLSGYSHSVYRGSGQPLEKPLQTAGEYHGAGGLGEHQVTGRSMEPSRGDAVNFIITQCLAHTESPLTLCAIGPLTNIATALQRCPDIRHGIKQVVIMGGALQVSGNVTTVAEFNMFVDPLAASMVFNSSLPVIMAPLDVTSRTCLPRSWLSELEQQASPVFTAMADMLRFYFRAGDGHMHDASAIAWLLRPDMFTTRLCSVTVERSGIDEGRTLADFSNRSGSVTTLMDVDVFQPFERTDYRLSSELKFRKSRINQKKSLYIGRIQ